MFRLVFWLGLGLIGFGCASASEEKPMRPIVEVINEHSEQLLTNYQIVMVYESRTTKGLPCIKVGISCSEGELAIEIPKRLEGYPVIVVETGEVAPR